jgi:nucleotide-binding universal stress UspA family protein
MKVAVGLDLDLQDFTWLLGRAVDFARRVRGTLDLVYVGEGEARREQLESLVATLPSGIRGRARVLPGDPAEQLVELTREVDVLVVGPREPTGLQRLFENAMAVRVLRRTACPVFVPRTEAVWPVPVRMLVGIDIASEKVDYVLRATSSLARALRGTVDLVHAVPGAITSSRRPELNAVLEREWRATQAERQERVDALLDLVDAPNRGTGAVVGGEAVDILVESSARYDLVLVGNRDHTGIERLLLGGVARTVAVRAQCDVLVLPTERQFP